MNRYVALMLNGEVVVAKGRNVVHAFGYCPLEMDFWIEADQKVTVATRRKFNRAHDVKIEYVYHKSLKYVIAGITPYDFDYPDFEGKVYATKEEMIEAVVKYLEEQGWKL
jgi:hypothetical protein